MAVAESYAEHKIFRFRDAARELSPWWLRRGIALKFLYVIAMHCDVLARMAQEAVRRRFPGLDSDDSLAIIGRERRITRGRYEDNATYAARLPRWLDDHRFRGGPYPLLAQLFYHYRAISFRIRLRYYSGRQFEMAATTGVVTRADVVWQPDADINNAARWWLFYDWPAVVVDDGVWGSAGTWGDGGTWGTSLLIEEVEDLKVIPTQWIAGHVSKGHVVLSEGTTELWGSGGTWGDPGTWGVSNFAVIDINP